MRRTARQQAPGAPDGVPGLLARRRDPSSTAASSAELRRQLMSQGQRNRQLPRVASHAARRDVAPGPRRARPRARPRGVRRRRCSATAAFVDFALALVAAARRADGARLAARPRAARPGRPRACSTPRSSGCSSKSWGQDATTLSVEDVPLLDELRYALGDVPDRAPRGGPRPRRTSLERRDMQELTTAADREYARSGAPGAADAPDRGRRATPTCSSTRRRTSRRCSGGWSAAAAAPRPGRSSATRPSRRGRCPPRRPPARAEALEGKDAPRVPPLDELPQLLRDLRLRRGVRRAGRPRRRPARPPSARPASRPRGAPASTDLRGGASARRWPRSPARSSGTVGDRRAGRPPRRGQRLAGVVAGARRGRPGARRGRLGGRAVGEDRVVVLTGLDTKGLEFDGIVVVAPAGDRGRVGHRPRDALRRAHPRDPAAHDGLLTRCPQVAPVSCVRTCVRIQ